MSTSPETRTPSPDTSRRENTDRRIGLGQLVIGLLSLILAVPALYFGWLQVRQSDDRAGDTASPPAVASTPPVTISSAAPPPGPAGTVYLDTLPPENGDGLLGELPRAVRGADGYTHALAIQCPRNNNGRDVREVSYALSHRYLRLDATVRPYYENEADRASVTHVTVTVGTRQRDGTISTLETGAQKSATMATPQALTADLEDGDILTIRVQCTLPTGVIILTEPRLTPAR